MHAFDTLIVQWQKCHGRHHLPWQKERSPYRVWVSEIMLQQTQVSTVISYFKRFMACFPTIQAMAMAKEHEIMRLWTGLGYYRRAQFMHRCAQIIHQQFGGEFPQDLEALQSLPGIGRSTAAAILTFGFNDYHGILDGNVKRILSRCFCIKGDIKKSAIEKQLWALAESLASADVDGVAYNQGLMDLGATVCTRKRPSCDLCPVQSICGAYQKSCVDQFPGKSASVKKKAQDMFLLKINFNHTCWLQERPDKGIWARLWCFPSFESLDKMNAWCASNDIENMVRVTTIKHVLTHRLLSIHLYEVDMVSEPKTMKGGVWYAGNDPLPGGVPRPLVTLLKQKKEENHV